MPSRDSKLGFEEVVDDDIDGGACGLLLAGAAAVVSLAELDLAAVTVAVSLASSPLVKASPLVSPCAAAAAGGVVAELNDDVDARPAPNGGAADGMGDEKREAVEVRSCAGGRRVLRAQWELGSGSVLGDAPPGKRGRRARSCWRWRGG